VKKLLLVLALLLAALPARGQPIFSLFQNGRAIPGAAVGDIYCTSTTAGVIVPLHLGSNTEVLTVDTTVSPCKLKWAAAGGGATSPLTTKGDIWGFSTLDARVPVGSDGLPLVANSGAALGLGYAVLGVAGGGTGGSSASGTLLDNITGFSSTGFIKRTGAGTYGFNANLSGVGSCTNQVATALNVEAAPTCTTITAAYTSGLVPGTRTVTGTAPITVDGDNSAHDLSADRTWACSTCATAAATLTSNAPVIGAAGQALAVTTAKTFRSVTVSNVEGGTGHGDSDYTILATDRLVYTNAAFTAPRTDTLPSANAVNIGGWITVADLAGTVTATNTLTIQRAGSDTINGGTSIVFNSAFASAILISDGSGKWNVASGAGSISGGGGGGGVTGTPVIVRDNFVASGGTTYTSSNTPSSSGTIYVTINGSIANTPVYSIAGTTLTISPALLSGTTIAWSYYTSLPVSSAHNIETFTSTGATDFALAHNPTAIEAVGLNGLTQNTTNYSLVAPNITRFVNAPISGASVTVAYLY